MKKNDWKIGDSCVWQRQKYMFQWISISKRLKTTKVAANRINQWWMCCQTKEAQNEMLESLFFQYNVKDQQDKLFMSDLVKALMPRPPAPPSQFSPALLRSFVTFLQNSDEMATGTCWGQGSGQEHGAAGTTRLLPWRESSQTRRWKQPSKWNICFISKSKIMLCSSNSNGLLWLVLCLCNWTIDQTMNNIPQVVVSHVPRKGCDHIGYKEEDSGLSSY